MKIDITSLCFGFKIEKDNDSGTAAWATSIGQAPKDVCYIDRNREGLDDIVYGMMYKSHSDFENLKVRDVPGVEKKEEPRGDRERMLFSVFEDVYVNNLKVNGIYTLTYEREDSNSHKNRLHICYAKYLTYKGHSNKDTLKEMAQKLGCNDEACWFVTDISIRNQKELCFTAIVVNPTHSMTYQNSKERKRAWEDMLPEYYESRCTDIPLQQIFYGAPGTGKSNTIKREVDDKGLPNVRTTFHPDSDYSTFVGAYKPIMGSGKVYGPQGPIKDPSDIHKDLEEPKIIYGFVPQAFLKAYTGAWKNLDEPFFLIIEEINRGNCAQIFGDLFQLLDRNDETGLSEYPISPDEDIQKFLLTDKKYGFAALTEEQKTSIPKEVLSGELMILPRNLHIWATMNTSDQSLFPIDSAFKRRWDWQYMPIADGGKEWQIAVKDKRYDWWQFLQKINAQIGSTTNSEDKKLGYFFCKAKDGVINVETFVGKVVFYIWNDVFKDFAEEAGDLFKDVEGILSFNKFYTIGIDGKTRVIEEKVERLLQNLGVEPFNNDEEDEDDDGNKKSSTNKNFDKFSINDKGNYGKNRLPFECIKEYVNRNSEKTADEVLEIWGKMNPGVPHFIESDEVYNNRTDISKKRSSNIKWNNGSVYVVLNGYGSNGMVEKFMDNVNNNSELLGLKIERIINQ